MTISSDTMRLLQLLLAHQQRLQSFTALKRPPLGLVEDHTLCLVSAHSSVSASELVGLLGVEKSTLSRVLATLQARSYLSVKADATDRRRQTLTVSALGNKMLEKTHTLLSEALLECVQPLSRSALAQLEDSFRTLADAFRSPPAYTAKDLHPLLRELRRLSRPFGILSAQFASTNLNVAEFHTLALIYRTTAPLRATEISATLNQSRASTSRIIARLHKLRLINLSKNRKDARSSLIAIGPMGKRLFSAAMENACAVLEATLKPYDNTLSAGLSELIATYAEPQKISSAELSGFKASLAKSPEVRQRACVFFVEELLRQGRQQQISEQLFSPSGMLCCITLANCLAGVCEFYQVKGNWELNKALFSAQYVQPETEPTLINLCHGLVNATSPNAISE